MALFTKQDFTPPLLSRKWFAVKFRPNVLLYSRENIILILESGLLFREDSIDVEQESPGPEEIWKYVGGGKNGWMTRGERVASALGVAFAVLLFPPRSFTRSSLINLSLYAALPIACRYAHRTRCRGSLPALLSIMREYLALARRTAACLKEYAALHAQIGSLTSVIESTHTLLCRQQSELAVLLSRTSSAVLGNAPWLRADVAWEAVEAQTGDNLMKIHHAFLVVQSALLKHIAMAHFVPPIQAQRIYKNHNERIHWLHTTVLPHITEQFQYNYESLERMYRLLKNSSNKDIDTKKLGTAFNDNWIYSEIHTGVAKSCLELKLALNKSNSLDVFLDSCAMNKQEIDLEVLNRDIDDIIDGLTKCLKTVQSSQLRLKKIQNKNVDAVQFEDKEVMVENVDILKIEDREPESKDEVFYFVRTDDDDNSIQPAGDLTTGPGKKEKETNKIVLSELKRKLGKREDVMRERERQALAKTMPELKDIPEFPRQINLDEFIERKGYIEKLKLKNHLAIPKKKLLHNNTKKSKTKTKKYKLKLLKYYNEADISDVIYEANAKLNVKSKLLSISFLKGYYITKWCKRYKNDYSDSSGLSEGLSDGEPSTASKKTKDFSNDIRFTKKDLELTPSSSESDFEYNKNEKKALLNDVRRHRAVRKKNHPNHRPVRTTDNVDESLKPIEYSFGTGLAMASVLQVNRSVPKYIADEEIFIGDGEVSTDSGNDEDA
uniref:Vezatin n=1 Tax=Heliothis virescens TaxID=7102 RepID=A0A2A4JGK9_HELVI